MCDAIYYFSAKEKPKLSTGPVDSDLVVKDRTRSIGDVRVEDAAKRITWLTLYILLRAEYPKPDSVTPSLVSTLLNCDYTTAQVRKSLCSFDLSKVVLGRIKKMRSPGMSQVDQDRITRRLVGYRLIHAIVNY